VQRGIERWSEQACRGYKQILDYVELTQDFIKESKSGVRFVVDTETVVEVEYCMKLDKRVDAISFCEVDQRMKLNNKLNKIKNVRK
jgi:hypothetical protein